MLWVLQLCDPRSAGEVSALPLGWGGGGKRNTQDDLTCLNQNRQVDLSLYACEHWHTILSGVSDNVTLYQGGQVHSPCQSSASYEAPETSTKRIRVSLNLSVPMALWRLEGTLLYRGTRGRPNQPARRRFFYIKKKV